MPDAQFRLATTLHRYIDKQFRQSRRRPSLAAFLLRRDIDEKSLSVNRADFESLNAIAHHYSESFEPGAKMVAVSTVKLRKYNDAAAAAGVNVAYDSATKQWLFTGARSKLVPAYKWTNGKPTQSHCGVEYLHHLSEVAEARFARRMAEFTFKKVRTA